MLSNSSDVATTAIMDVIRFVQHSDDRRVRVTILIVRLEDLSEDVIFRVLFSDNLAFRLDRLVGQSSGLCRDLLLM